MFIGRNLDGSIYGTWTSQQREDADHPRLEELPDDHPDVLDFQKTRVAAPAVSKALRDAVLNDPSVPLSLKALLNVLPDTKDAFKVSAEVIP